MNQAIEEPNPWIAFAGILLPGAGHFLAGDRTRAIAIFALVHALVALAVLNGAAVAPPISPEPLAFSGIAQSDPIGNIMRTLERVAQGATGIALFVTKFFGYNQPFDGSFANTFFTNLLNLGGLLNLLAVFYLFDSERNRAKAYREHLAAARKEKKR
jgi:hypothetical protein